MKRILPWLAFVLFVVTSHGAIAQDARQIRLVVLGDSLSAGFLIPGTAAFPAVLESALRQQGLPVTVANAGVSGNTVADGLARLDGDVPEGTDGVVLELGANDKLQRRDPMATQAALSEIVRRLQTRGIAVLVAGIRFADAAGAPYNGIFPSIAKRFGAVYYPDIYAGLSANRRLTIFDGVHPSPEGVGVMVAGILPTAERFVKALMSAKTRRQ